MAELLHKTDRIRKALAEAIDRDTQAFNKVRAVFTMPKDTDDEKDARIDAMQEALKAGTIAPFEIMTLSMEALELTQRASGRSNASAASDLGVAALSLKSAVQGAWLNILINIPGITDKAFSGKYRTEGEAILKKALPMADEIYNSILQNLNQEK
jgi:formiminotetrahydrofolate cyclodeaminase